VAAAQHAAAALRRLDRRSARRPAAPRVRGDVRGLRDAPERPRRGRGSRLRGRDEVLHLR